MHTQSVLNTVAVTTTPSQLEKCKQINPMIVTSDDAIPKTQKGIDRYFTVLKHK